MRLIYMDEAGRSNPQQEPYFVVAGVLLDGDQDWVPVERHLKSLVRKHLPEEDRSDNFVFHAMDIWHGSRYFDREKWPLQKRLKILADLASIPKKFHLTIVTGFVHRLSALEQLRRAYPDAPETTHANMIYVQAFMSAAKAADSWMKTRAPREAAMIIAEKSGKIQTGLKQIHNGFSSDSIDEYWSDREYKKYTGHAVPEFFTTNRIIDTVHFAGKDESKLLQLADTAAFFIKRQLMKKSDSSVFFEQLAPCLYPAAKRHGDDAQPTQMHVQTLVRVRLPLSHVRLE